jgi:hypothetical protein
MLASARMKARSRDRAVSSTEPPGLNPAIDADMAGFARRDYSLAGEARSRRLRGFMIFAAVWMVAMTWRVHPQFSDMLKVDDRLVTLDGYVEETCGERIGPDARSCLEEARATGERLVARQQGQSVLFILAPLLAYLVGYLPWQIATALLARARVPTD